MKKHIESIFEPETQDKKGNMHNISLWPIMVWMFLIVPSVSVALAYLFVSMDLINIASIIGLLIMICTYRPVMMYAIKKAS